MLVSLAEKWNGQSATPDRDSWESIQNIVSAHETRVGGGLLRSLAGVSIVPEPPQRVQQMDKWDATAPKVQDLSCSLKLSSVARH